MRVVSVLPSATEIVHRLGAGSMLVGRSEECDHPAVVRDLPVVMRAIASDRGLRSREIDARVRASMAAGKSLYRLDLDQLRELQPDLLLTQDLCRVCSVTDAEVAAACRAAGIEPRILSLAPTRWVEVLTSIEEIGAAIGRSSEARLLVDELRGRPSRSAVAGSVRVAILEWIDPVFESGLWTPDLVAEAGGTAWSCRAGGAARTVSLDALRSDPPAAVVVSPCSFGVERTVAELGDSPLGALLRELPVPAGVWIADEAFFSRPGPRLGEGRELVRQILTGSVDAWDGRVRPWVAARPGLAA
jgi:iron complex transport system substrate-binding protein